MNTIVLDFFRIWGGVITAVSGVVTAASALIALVHYLRHWRDDEVRLAVEFDTYEPYVDINGCWSVNATVTITNVGKVPVTITGFAVDKKSIGKRVTVDKASYVDHFIDQGASVKDNAIISAKDSGVPLPKRIPIRVKWAKCGKNAVGVAIVKLDKPSPAGK